MPASATTSWKRSSAAAEAREAAAAVRRDNQLAAALEPQVRRVFRQELAAVLAAEAGGPAAMRQAVSPARWENLLARVWLGQAPEAVWGSTLAKLGGPDLDWRDYLPERLGPLIQRQARLICDTTLRELEGMPVKDAARRRAVRRLYRAFGGSRAGRVALGAVVQATATVQHVAAQAVARINQATITKTWVTVGDDRVRPSHAAAGGQTRLEDEPFSVGGASLMYPRDPDGPAGEIINCRCWAVYETTGGHSSERGAIGRGTPDTDVQAEQFTQGALTDTLRQEARERASQAYQRMLREHAQQMQTRDPSVPGGFRTLTEDEFVDRTVAAWQDWLEKSDVTIAIEPRTLQRVLDDGRFKSQFETSSSMGALDPALRSTVEEQLWGYGVSSADELRPIYGYMGRRLTRNKIAETYGSAQVRLKASVRARTTVTGDDSLYGVMVPSPVDRLDMASIPWDDLQHPHVALRPTSRYYSPAADMTGDWKGTYMEAQVHGQVTVADIDMVVVQQRAGFPPPESLLTQLDEMGIRYVLQEVDD